MRTFLPVDENCVEYQRGLHYGKQVAALAEPGSDAMVTFALRVNIAWTVQIAIQDKNGSVDYIGPDRTYDEMLEGDKAAWLQGLRSAAPDITFHHNTITNWI